MLLIKWVGALLVPVIVFTFVWNGDLIVNNVLLGLLSPGSSRYDTPTLIQAAIFMAIFYLTIVVLAGYLLAADSGRRNFIEVWADVLVFAVVPIVLVDLTANLIIGIALCAIVWPIYFYLR